MKLNQEKLFWLAIGLTLGATLGVGGMTLSKRTQPAPIVIIPAQPTPLPEPTTTPGPIRVYVNGQVAIPAVYELPPGSIVEQAIGAAGGFTTAANTAVVNLAQPLADGAQVYVPAEGETASVPTTIITVPTAASGSGSVAASGVVGSLINLNTATLEELDTLPGIGPSTAQKIIEYREQNGPFLAVEDVMNVSGIGPAKFDAIKDLVTISE